MSAGIFNENVKKNYLRYCQDYYVAWIEFLPKIAEVMRKHDGKKITKRIDTALRNIDNRLSFRIEKSTYGDGGYVYFDWHDFDARIFRDEESGEWDYVKDSSGGCGVLMHHVDSMENFDAEQFINALNNRADGRIKERERVLYAIDNLNQIKAEYNKARAEFMKAQDNVPSAIRDYFGCTHHYIGEWR